jgi:broad specificity phosphatase PhoE
MAVNELWLARHGETEWTLSRQHTSSTDLEITPNGEVQARALGERVRGRDFALVCSSPMQRARRTAELAGFGDRLEILDDFREWDYGEYEGVTTDEIHETRPDWDLWRDGCPGGETVEQVAARADRLVERIHAAGGPVLCFGHGHMSRVLGARYLGLDGTGGRHLMMGTATLSIIGDEHDHPAIRLWNEPPPG